MQLYYPFIDQYFYWNLLKYQTEGAKKKNAAINNAFTRLCECACLNKKDVHDGDCASLLSACPTGAAQAFALPDDIEVDIKNLLSVCVSPSVVLCRHTDIYCRIFPCVSKAIYSNRSVSHLRGWIMACEVRETYKLDGVLCHWRDLTVAHYCGHLAVDTPCSEEGLTMTEW